MKDGSFKNTAYRMASYLPLRREYSHQRTEDISLRDYFAGQAMQAMLSNPNIDLLEPDCYANDAYNLADAMLAERERTI